MARGWESKSVEDQQAEAQKRPEIGKPRLTPEQAARKRRREELELARIDLLRQMEGTQNPQRRNMLQDALAELDRRLHQTD